MQSVQREHAEIQKRADAVFQLPTEVDNELLGEDEDLLAEWPDELMLLGLGVDEGEEIGSTTSTTSGTSPTEETASDDDDVWPVEMIVG